MKLTVKVFCCTIIVLALSMGFGGYFLISSTFNAAIGREVRQALNESGILCFTIETVMLSVPLQTDSLQDETIGEIASTLETGRFIRISGEQRQTIYTSPHFADMDSLLDFVDQDIVAYRIIKNEDAHFVHTGLHFYAAGRFLYLETLTDITAIFAQRDSSLAVYRHVTIVTLVFGAFAMYMFSLWITKPIRMLTRVTRSFASGNYNRRAKKLSSDELGLLTDDFNKMADALQDKINELRDGVAARERFIGAFSHEIKTPLTSIIGYADMLRSRKLTAEDVFLSADYIYKEGRRLEHLSLRLLDILVLGKGGLKLKHTPVSSVFDLIGDMFGATNNIVMQYDEAVIQTESALLSTMLINIVDNALKASGLNTAPSNNPAASGGTCPPVEITGRLLGDKYRFAVKDYGCGIASEDINKLTQAFYMVDKSRSRRFGGAGLGLTLCASILVFFNSELEITSCLGEGTVVSFELELAPHSA